MTTDGFVLVPVRVERQFAVSEVVTASIQAHGTREKRATTKPTPFWTWFIDNPQPTAPEPPFS